VIEQRGLQKENTVDEAAGLKGRRDYILARGLEQLALTAPDCVLVVD
jgi:hypothetical protein